MSSNYLGNRTFKRQHKKIFCLIAVVCLFLFFLPGCAGAAEPQTNKMSAGYTVIDKYIGGIQKEENIPGISIVVVQNDKILYCKAYGVAGVESNEPLTTATLFDLASLTKSFTALAVLLLEDQGLIDIDQPLQKYLPDFQIADPRGADITVRQLLNQTGGIPGILTEILIFNDSYEDLLASLNNLRLNNEPGSVFEYADLNYCLLGALIERQSGMTYEKFMDVNIFKPLGMNRTTADPNKAEKLGKADGHQSLYGKTVVRNIPSMKSARAAGWVMSSAQDMGKWLMVNLNNGVLDGKQIIPADAINELHKTAVIYEDNNEKMAYGMGWSISCYTDILYYFHCGDTPNFTTDMLLLPDYNTGIVVLVNGQVSTNNHDIATKIANTLLGLDLNSMNVPWWAHWKALDTLATGILFPITVLFIGMIIYLVWLLKQLWAGKRCFFWSRMARNSSPIWQIVLYPLPMALFLIVFAVGNIVLNALYGYNIFVALGLFRMGAPPGLYLSGILSIAILISWALLLVLVVSFTRQAKQTC